MADELPTVDDFGRPVDPALAAPPQAAPASDPNAPKDNFFSQFLTGAEKSYGDMGFGQRVADTAKANFYSGTLLGVGIARNQADPAGRSRALNEGLSDEEKAFNEKIIADWEAQELAKRKTMENPVTVTDAQVAQIQNKMHPGVGGVGDVAADVLGALGGGLASPEMLVLPSFRAAEGLAAAAPVTARFLDGMAGRMLNTGVSMAVLNTATNPVVQKTSVEAGLQPEFDPMRLGLAPLEGFVGGALLHGAMEGAGRGIGYVAGQVRRGFSDAIWTRITDPLKEDPAFRLPGERAPMVEREKIGEAPDFGSGVGDGQSRSISANDGQPASMQVGTSVGSAMAGEPAPASFQTAKGSTYQIHEDGTTSRNKAARNDVGHEGDYGEKPRTEKTVYIDPAEAQRLAPPQGKWRIIDHGDGTLSLSTQNPDGRWGIADSARNVPVSDTPEVGKSPVELWNQESVNGLPAYGKLHLGNEIVKIERRASVVQTARLSEISPEARARFAEELKTAGVDPAHIDPELSARADALGISDAAAAHESAAIARAYDAPETRDIAREVYGRFKVADVQPERMPSLLQALAKAGLKPDPELKAIFGGENPFFPGSGRLIRKKGGMTLDEALTAATEGRYIRDSGFHGDGERKADINTLLDAIRQDHAATKDAERVFPEGFSAAERKIEAESLRVGAELDAAEKHVRDVVKISEDHEPPPDQVWRDAAAHMVLGGEKDAHRAFDRAVLDYERTQGDHEALIRAAHGNGEADRGVIRARAGYDEAGRVADAGQEFPGFERTGGEPGSGPSSGLARSERTAAGEQRLVPGVEPVTDRQRAEFAAAKPLRGGDAPPGGMFDDANTRQPDLQFKKNSPSGPAGVGGTGQAGAGSSGAQRAETVLSLQQQALALGDTLGIPIRQGRVQGGKDVAGQFSKYGVARVRDIADFLTVAHEGGHGLERKIGPELTGLINGHAAELGPLDYEPAKARPSEGFAEWFALSLTNPAAAQQKAPGFNAAFRRFLGQSDPALIDALDRAAASFKAYLDAPSDVRVASQVVSKGETGWFAETAAYMKKEGFPATIGKVIGDAYTAFFDDKAPVARTVRDLARLFRENNGGKALDLKSADNPETLVRLFGRAQQGAIYQMRYGVVPYRDVTPQGASLHDAIATATGAAPVLGRWRGASVDDFSTYLVAKRAAVLWDRFDAGKLDNPPVAFSRADADATIAALAQANPGFEKGAQMVHDYTRNMLTKQRDAGLIGQDLYETLSADPFYVPLFRDVSDKPVAGKTGGGSASDGPGLTDTIKRMRGSSRDIIDPLQGIMMQTFLAERTIRHNDIIKAFADLAERAGPGSGAFVEPVPAKELRGTPFDLAENIRSVARQRGLDPADTALLMNSVTNAFGDDPIMGTMFKMQPAAKKGEPILFYKVAGDLKAVRFTSDKEGQAVYETLAALPDALKDLTLQVMQGAASTLRFGVTANPVFIATNFIRDQMALGVLRPDYVPFFSGARGLKSELTQDRAAQLYAYFGGVSPGAAVTDTRGMMDADIGSIAVKGYAAARLNLSSPKEFAHGLVEAMQVTESASRNSVFAKVYEQKIAQGLTPYEAAIEAAYQGTDILDFGRHGSRTMALRQLVPFLNAHLQGLDLGRRTILEPLARAARGDVLTTREQAQVRNAYISMLKFSALGSALGFGYAALAWDREEYRDANNDMKATHLIIPWGHKVITIPKPFELALGFNAGEAAFAALVGKDPRAAANFTEGAWEVIKPPNPITGNPLIKTTFEVALNRNLFTGRDIVPDSLKAVDPQHQFTERTSMFARKTGDITNAISDFLKEHTNSEAAKLMGFGDAWSPIKVDYALGSLFGMWGKDIQAASNWFAGDDDKPESQFEDMVFLRRFLKDPNRSGEMTKRYFEFAAQKTGQYAQAVNTYDRYVGMYQDQKAKDWLATLGDDKKAFVVLNSGANEEDGKRAFSADDRRIHPVTRAQAALSQLNSITRELTFNAQINSETGERYSLTPVQRRDAIEALHQLGAQEMRNALVIVGDKGYQDRSVLDTAMQEKVIRAISPEVADEVARRYATGKVLPAASVSETWPEARSRLLRDGSEADLSDLTAGATAAGYEFGGERTRKREKRRGAVRGAGAPETVQ